MAILTISRVAVLRNKVEMMSSLQKISRFLSSMKLQMSSLSLVAKITFPSDYALKLLIKRVGACFLSRAAVSILSRAVFSPRFSGHTRENKIYYRVIPDSRLAFSTRRERGNLC